MSEPWFDPVWFGALYGAIVGGGGGTLLGCLGALAGFLAPQGKGRTFILGGFWFFVLLGVASLAFGLYALIAGQPYAIWYAPLLCGFVMSLVSGCLIPVLQVRYAQAEQRRLESEAIRNS